MSESVREGHSPPLVWWPRRDSGERDTPTAVTPVRQHFPPSPPTHHPATPFGSTGHYLMFAIIDIFGIDITLKDMNPAAIKTAWAQPSGHADYIDGTCCIVQLCRRARRRRQRRQKLTMPYQRQRRRTPTKTNANANDNNNAFTQITRRAHLGRYHGPHPRQRRVHARERGPARQLGQGHLQYHLRQEGLPRRAF